MQDLDRESFHKVVAKSLYAAKRARPDIMTSISFLTKRVKEPDHDDWEKLEHMINYLMSADKLPLILSANNSDILYWYAVITFAIHPNMRSHNRAGLMLGRGLLLASAALRS